MENTIFSPLEKSCSECRFWTHFCNFLSTTILHFYLKVMTKCPLQQEEELPLHILKRKICYIEFIYSTN